MLRLMLLRHAKAEADSAEGDHSRRLSPRGMQDVTHLGDYLAGESLLPDLILASSATRTAMTMTGLLAIWPEHVAVRLISTLYNAGASALLDEIHRQRGDARTLMLVGHNPGIAELALGLTGSGDRYALARLRQKFPPCALAVLDFASDSWGEVAPGEGRLERYLTPGPLEAAP
ncbi:MAG: histidine phosphatase family protein [Hyphomicrobiales bacterium]|nr:histidine phosphatase family protein [Hyphomicrobiales bacterium]